MGEVTASPIPREHADETGVRAACIAGRWYIERLTRGVITRRIPAPTRGDALRVADRTSLRDGVSLLPMQISPSDEAPASRWSRNREANETGAITDRAWFATNPGRAYRARPVPRQELALWSRPPTADRFPWCIVRRSDASTRCFTLPAHAELDDDDAELGAIFLQLRERRTSPARIFPPAPGGSLSRIESSLSALLMASVPYEPDAPPAEAYRMEMRARGWEALAIGGRETLAYLAERITQSMPERAAVHAAILQVAWDGLVELRA